MSRVDLPDDLPSLSGAHPLAPPCIEEFQSTGHTCVRGLASPQEISAYRPILEDVALCNRFEKRALEERDTYGRAFLQILNLWLLDRRAQAFVFAQRFARVAAELLGVPAVRLYHDQALFKEAGGGYTPWHQDQFYWPLDTPHTVTLWIALVDIPKEVGSMVFASGSQAFGNLGDLAIGDESHRHFERWIDDHGLARETHGAMRAGDATFHAGWTLHSAGANPTDQMRSAMTVIYFADGARLGPLDHPSRRLDRAFYFPSAHPGDLARSELTPLLYPTDSNSSPTLPGAAHDYRGWIADAFRRAGQRG